jgi:uncharacterized phage protein gp47/JayE
MVFERKTFAQIFEAMRDRTPPALSDFQEGSVVRTMFESFAYEIAVLYAQMDRVYLSAYVDTAEGVQLEQVVAILGIKRGEPDFATGKVTFERDIGIDEDILIPIGTLVTTSEDTDESPKKAYKTIEAKTLNRDTTSIEVRVQAIQAGETQKTDAQTITVMPLPITGVKSVSNKEPILFTGKQQETDEELRDRAKKTLLAASGANTTAIENALMSLPGVKQVQVRENFHYARGEVTLTRDGTSETVTIPKGTELKIDNKSFKTTQKATITDSGSVTVNVQALVAGQAGQVTQENETVNPVQIDNLSVSLKVKNEQPILLRDFGLIEVFVDGIDFSDTTKVSQLQQEIDRVRAAGIYVLLKSAIPVTVNGVFKIELVSGLKLPQPERIKLEEAVQKVIKSHILEQKMGEPLLISQLTKKLLEIKGVNDLEDFTLEIWRETGEYAEGKVTLHYKEGYRPVTIPAKTRLKTDKKQSFESLEEADLGEQDASKDVLVRAIVEGKPGELINAGQAVTWQNLVLEGTNKTTLTISNAEPIQLLSEKYKSSENPVKRLSVDVLEKFTPGYIRVASEIKVLPVDVDVELKTSVLAEALAQAKAQGKTDTPDKEKNIIASIQAAIQEATVKAINNYFDTQRLKINKDEIHQAIQGITDLSYDSIRINIGEVGVRINPHFWQSSSPFNGQSFEVSFVEKAQASDIFIYDNTLEITGAFQLTLPVTVKGEEKREIYKAVRSKIEDYLETLKPEEKIKIDKLVKIAKSVNQVLEVIWKVDDFQVGLENQIIQDRIDKDKKEIRVEKFEKPQLAANFAINSDIQQVDIAINAVTFKLDFIAPVPQDINKDQLQEVMKKAIANIFDDTSLYQNLPKFPVGQNLDYAQFKISLLVLVRDKVSQLTRDSIKNFIDATAEKVEQVADSAINFFRSADYSIDKLELKSSNLALPTGDILIRSIERAQISPISKDKVTVEIDIPPPMQLATPNVNAIVNEGKALRSRIPPQ